MRERIANLKPGTVGYKTAWERCRKSIQCNIISFFDLIKSFSLTSRKLSTTDSEKLAESVLLRENWVTLCTRESERVFLKKIEQCDQGPGICN